MSLLLLIWVFVQGVDERELNCLSTFVLIEAARYESFFFDGFFVLGVTDMVELLRMFSLEDSLR